MTSDELQGLFRWVADMDGTPETVLPTLGVDSDDLLALLDTPWARQAFVQVLRGCEKHHDVSFTTDQAFAAHTAMQAVFTVGLTMGLMAPRMEATR